MSLTKTMCGILFPIMTMKTEQRRLPAEWEPQGAVMVAWPHETTDWAYILPEVERCYDSLVRAIARHAVAVVVAPDTSGLRLRFQDLPADRILFFDTPTNDTWTRDYGVITTLDTDGSPILCDFGFNAWGGKFESRLDNGVTARMFDAGLLKGKYENNNDFILEGGSIESDGHGTVLTTESCLLTPTRNPEMSRGDIEKRLADALGVRKLLWLGSGAMMGDDTDGHIDTLARLAPDNTILYTGPGQNEDNKRQNEALEGILSELQGMTNADGEPFNLIELPCPDPIHDPEDGHQLPATYANFLVINDAVLMPVYGQPMNDLRAEMTLKVAFPNHEIERIDCRPLIRQHGSLHCATMQLPNTVLPI